MVAVVLGFVGGAGSLAFPYWWWWPAPDAIESWGVVLAFMVDGLLVVFLLTVGIPVTVWGRRGGPARPVAVGLLCSVGAYGVFLGLSVLRVFTA
jgi:hypothetical protein